MRFITFLIATLVLTGSVYAYNTVNVRELNTKPYSFDVVGHLYPKSNQYWSEQKTTDFTVFTGDVVDDGCNDWPDFIYNAQNIEHYIAPGNHDKAVNCPENYTNNGYFSYHRISKQGDQFIFLDGNINNWNIRWGQKTFLQNALNEPARNRFIFIHQVAWADDSSIQGWTPNSNHLRAPYPWLTWESDVRPIIENAGDDVYVIAGDLGQHNGGSYDTTVNGVRYIGNGLGPGTSVYMKIGVSTDGRVWINKIVL